MIFIKNLKFCYRLRAEYSGPIRHHSFSVAFLPSDSNRQKISNLKIEVADCENFCITSDNFKNGKFYGLIEKEHSSFDITVSGTAQTGLDIFEEYTASPFDFSLLKAQSRLTDPGERLIEYYKNLELDELNGAYEKAIHIMNTLHYTYIYKSGATEVHSTAEEALSIGSGVCQDYAHIMISLLRMENIPARYVVGMMLGEGASHAWVEVLCNGYWYGFDPTNNKLVNDEYIRVSCGRDSNDCSVIRGKFYGVVTQRQTESVLAEEI